MASNSCDRSLDLAQLEAHSQITHNLRTFLTCYNLLVRPNMGVPLTLVRCQTSLTTSNIESCLVQKLKKVNFEPLDRKKFVDLIKMGEWFEIDGWRKRTSTSINLSSHSLFAKARLSLQQILFSPI